MSFRVQVMPAAARQIRKLDRQTQRRIAGAIDLLAAHPRPPAARQLVGAGGAWRVRVGDYRIVYEIHDDLLVVLVVAVGHRREAYRSRG